MRKLLRALGYRLGNWMIENGANLNRWLAGPQDPYLPDWMKQKLAMQQKLAFQRHMHSGWRL